MRRMRKGEDRGIGDRTWEGGARTLFRGFPGGAGPGPGVPGTGYFFRGAEEMRGRRPGSILPEPEAGE